MADLGSHEYRKGILEDIQSEENKERKKKSVKEFEVYRGRQENFLLQKLKAEFSESTVKEMRLVSSVNLAKRIVEESASIYKSAPERTFSRDSGILLTDNEKAQLDNLYDLSDANVKLKQSNRYFKLFEQTALQMIPRNGEIIMKALSPHHYDVVPTADIEDAEIYILNVFDKSDTFVGADGIDLSSPTTGIRRNATKSISDGVNQGIGDPDDYSAHFNKYIWWSKEFHFMTNGSGQIIEELSPADLLNPIGMLPFIDIAGDKDGEFWVRSGSTDTEFSLDMALLITDYVNVAKMQGHAVSIIFSEKPPKDMTIGTNRVLHIPLDPNKEVQPRFEFQSPNADLSAHKEMIESIINLYLTSKGIDPQTVSGTASTKTYSSGLERLLAMIDRFEASRDDIDLYKTVEDKSLDLFIAWSNLLQGVSDKPLVDKLQLATLPDDVYVDVKFRKPEVVQTKSEIEDSAIKLMDAGLMSKSEAISELREIDEEAAEEVIEKIDEQAFTAAPVQEPLDAESEATEN